MLTNRAIVIEKDIDLARCQSNWQAIPELARKFKKHNPNGIGKKKRKKEEEGVIFYFIFLKKEKTFLLL